MKWVSALQLAVVLALLVPSCLSQGSAPAPTPDPDPGEPYEPDRVPVPKGPVDPVIPPWSWPDIEPGPDPNSGPGPDSDPVPESTPTPWLIPGELPPEPAPNPDEDIPGSEPSPEPSINPPSVKPPKPYEPEGPGPDPAEGPWPDIQPGPDLAPEPVSSPEPSDPVPEPPPVPEPEPVPVPEPETPEPPPVPGGCPGFYHALTCESGVWVGRNLTLLPRQGQAWKYGTFRLEGQTIIRAPLTLTGADVRVEGDLLLQEATLTINSNCNVQVTGEIQLRTARLHFVTEEKPTPPTLDAGCIDFGDEDGDIMVELEAAPTAAPYKLATLSGCTAHEGSTTVVAEFDGTVFCGTALRGEGLLAVTISPCTVPTPFSWRDASVEQVLHAINESLWKEGLEKVNSALPSVVAAQIKDMRPNKHLSAYEFLFDRNVTALVKDLYDILVSQLIYGYAHVPLDRIGKSLRLTKPSSNESAVTWESGWILAVPVLHPSHVETPSTGVRPRDTALWVVLGIFVGCITIIVAVIILMLRRRSSTLVKYQPISDLDEQERLLLNIEQDVF